ncbi:MAG: class I SAM-dependent methyltransferase [Candidatus Riflebacteria bacterium]|nr:class I SAM-dependent methyltransferase [Candidatus Riflebacteria bacterium]
MKPGPAQAPRPLVQPPAADPLADWDADHADSFGRVADEVFAPMYPFLVQDVAAVLGRPLAGLVVLEIGGGVGNMALEMLRAGVARLDDLDISAAMLDRAGARLAGHPGLAGRFRPVLGEAGALPFAAGSYDLVFSRGSIQFWPDIPAALAGIRRVLRPDGLAYVGGGFGLSTPPALRDSILREKEARMAQMRGGSPMPQLDKAELLAAARSLGGRARLVQGDGGFWVQWFPHRPADGNRE